MISWRTVVNFNEFALCDFQKGAQFYFDISKDWLAETNMKNCSQPHSSDVCHRFLKQTSLLANRQVFASVNSEVFFIIWNPMYMYNLTQASLYVPKMKCRTSYYRTNLCVQICIFNCNKQNYILQANWHMVKILYIWYNISTQNFLLWQVQLWILPAQHKVLVDRFWRQETMHNFRGRKFHQW